MEITLEQFKRIESVLPKQRGNVKHDNLLFLNALLYVAENGCKWRALPKHFGPWHSIYTRMNRWAKSGVIDQIFTKLQEENILKINISLVSLDSTSVKVHPDGTGALKKTADNPLENQEGAGHAKYIWLPQMLERLSN